MDHGGLAAVVLAGLHGAGDDVLLGRRGHLLVADLARLVEVIDQGVVLALVEEFLGRGAHVVDATVADVYRGQSATMEEEEAKGGSHLLGSFVVGLVEGLVGRLQRLAEHLVGDDLLGIDVVAQILGKALADDAARHLAMFVASHAVAEDEEEVLIGSLSLQGPNAVLLVISLPELIDGLGLSDCYFHVKSLRGDYLS